MYGEVPPKNSAVGGRGGWVRWVGSVGGGCGWGRRSMGGREAVRARCSVLSLHSAADSCGRVATIEFSARKTLLEYCLEISALRANHLRSSVTCRGVPSLARRVRARSTGFEQPFCSLKTERREERRDGKSNFILLKSYFPRSCDGPIN